MRHHLLPGQTRQAYQCEAADRRGRCNPAGEGVQRGPRREQQGNHCQNAEAKEQLSRHPRGARVDRRMSGYAVVDHIEAPDDHTVIFKLKEPNGGFFDNQHANTIVAGGGLLYIADSGPLPGERP